MACTCNPLMTGDANAVISLGSPLANYANAGALQAKQGYGANISRELNFTAPKGSAVSGNYEVDNNRKMPNIVNLIIDTTANSSQVITDYPLLDNQGAYKAYNTVLQATAAVGTVYGRTSGDLTKVYMNEIGNTQGYDLWMTQVCVDGILLESCEIYNVVSDAKTIPAMTTKIIHYNVGSSQWQTQQFRNSLDNISCKDSLVNVMSFDRSTRHFPGLAVLVLTKLKPGLLYYVNLAIAGV